MTIEDSSQQNTVSNFDQEYINRAKRGFYGFFVRRPKITWLAAIAVILLGLFGLLNIPRESDPEVKIPIAVVATAYPGASPIDVEQLVTDKIETQIDELDNVKLVTSNSALGISSIVVEFEAEADLDKSIRELKDKVDEVRDLPDDATDPVVTQIRANDQPIITFSLSGPLGDREFKQLGTIVQDALERIPGVSEAPLLGVTDREFSVVVDRAALNQLNLPLDVVVAAIASANADMPLGDIAVDKVNYNIRTVAKITSIDQLNNIVVSVVNGTPVLLGDIADISDTFADQKTISRLSVAGSPASHTISLQVFKKTGGNILDIVDAAHETLDKLKADKVIPSTVMVTVSSDFSQFIRDDMTTLGSSGIQSMVLIFIIMILAMTPREALIATVAIPVTLLLTLGLLYFFGQTLNSLTLFSLVLSLGLLVDVFIVILEGMFRNLRKGYSVKSAALLTVAHYTSPLYSGTLTTVAAFVPMLLVSGILGEYLKILPITITITLLSSLFVALAFVPGVGTTFLKPHGTLAELKPTVLEKYFFHPLLAWYRPLIDRILRDRRRKQRIVITLVVLFCVSLGLLVSGFIPVKLFPSVDIDFSFIDIELPIGTELSVTNDVVQEVENYLYTRDDIESFVSVIGQSAAGFGFGSGASTNEHVASITVNWIDESARGKKSYELDQEMRDYFKTLTRGKVTVREISGGPPTGAPIEARILGDDLTVLDQLSAQLVDILNQTDGVIDVETDRKLTPPDMTFTFNRQALAEAGLGVGEVSRFLRTAIFGVTASEVNIDGEDVDIVVRLDKERIQSVEALQNLSLINGRGESVKLSRVADFSFQSALASIPHRNFERTATVRANLESGFVPAKVVPEVEQKMTAAGIPSGYSVNFGGEVEDIEQSFSELWNAMIVALLLILLLMVWEFDKFKEPIIIMLTMPFTLIGVVAGMLLLRLPFSFSVFIGLVSLAGIVVNNAILLLDKTKRDVEELAVSPRQAILNAIETRLKPIFLTTATTIVGILPLAFADEFWLGLSISLAFGLGFATVLQLLIVPIFYLQLEGKDAQKRRGEKLHNQNID